LYEWIAGYALLSVLLRLTSVNSSGQGVNNRFVNLMNRFVDLKSRFVDLNNGFVDLNNGFVDPNIIWQVLPGVNAPL
jgi:hypothetical protein